MPRRWTPEVDAEADVLYRKESMPKLRQRQDLATLQTDRAIANERRAGREYPNISQRAAEAIEDLQAMHDACTREIARRTDRRFKR